ncbi:unnamed protein product, partial [Musa textilis]
EASSSLPPSRRRRPSDVPVGRVGYVGSTPGAFRMPRPTCSSGTASSSWDPRLMFPLFAWVLWHLWVHFCLLLGAKGKRFCMPN